MSEQEFTKGERMNAFLAHASILLGVISRGVLGIVLAFAIWFTQRDKAEWAANQALQALAYQLIGIVVTVFAWIAWGFIFLGSVFTPVILSPRDPQAIQPYFMIPALAMMILPFAVMLGWVAYGLYAAVQVWHGKDFSYPVIGRWLRGRSTALRA